MNDGNTNQWNEPPTPLSLKGTYATAIVYAQQVESQALDQIRELCNQPFSQGVRIRVMPDVHAGAGCVIGLTMDLVGSDKVCPNLVGVDIGCGVRVCELGKVSLDLQRLDEVIRAHVPSGTNVRSGVCPQDRQFFSSVFEPLRIRGEIEKTKNVNRLEASLGTLGGGNHFIEVDADEQGNQYLVVHTGSRHLGYTVGKAYQKIAVDKDREQAKNRGMQRIQEKVRALQQQGRFSEIETAIRKREKDPVAPVSKDLAYLEGEDREAYLHDIRLVQAFAVRNRQRIMETILQQMGCNALGWFESVHNYIDDDAVLRKGAISAHEQQRLIIPLNMRDGCILGRGKGNAQWNFSAPHGAGRLMSRGDAKRSLSMEEFQRQMQGIFSTSVDQSTLDESPMAYKPKEFLLSLLPQTVWLDRIVHPVYNFKASE